MALLIKVANFRLITLTQHCRNFRLKLLEMNSYRIFFSSTGVINVAPIPETNSTHSNPEWKRQIPFPALINAKLSIPRVNLEDIQIFHTLSDILISYIEYHVSYCRVNAK